MTDREELARIIDPTAFEYGDKFGAARHAWESAIEQAFALADAILAAGWVKTGWRPIEEAPRDGTAILLYCPDEYEDCDHCKTAFWGDVEPWEAPKKHSWFDWEGAGNEIPGNPTHFMPLPSPPTGEGQ